MRKFLTAVILLGILAVSVGCAAAPTQRAAPPAAPAATMAPAAASADQATSTSNGKAASNESTAGGENLAVSGGPNDAERMIVRNVDMSLIVTDAETTIQAITKMVSAANGYIADSNAWRDGDRLRAQLTVRIPASALDGTLASLRGLAVRVERENVTGQDVTEEYTDLNAQLTNLEATEKELRELLTEVRQRTQKAEEVLAVYRELTTIRGQIEQIKGRMQYLSSVTSMATLKIDLVPDALAQLVVEPGWRPMETLKNASRASVNMLKSVVDGGIWLVIYVVPLLIVIAIPFVVLFFAVRWLVRRSRRAVPPKSLAAQ
jgi:hypothetical protein